MYEGYLQHDAQEVLQCILGYIQEACDTIRKEQEVEEEDSSVTEVKTEKTEVKTEKDDHLCSGSSETEAKTPAEEDGQVSGKRKSDTEVGNAKKKTKSVKSKKSDSEEDGGNRNKPFTRSKRKSSSEITVENTQDKDGEVEEANEGTQKQNKEKGGESDGEGKGEKASKEADGKRQKRAKLSWLRPSGNQPSIFSKFRSVGKITSMTPKNQTKPEPEIEPTDDQTENEKTSREPLPQNTNEDKAAVKTQGRRVLSSNCFHY